jgi:hypothetical protein
MNENKMQHKYTDIELKNETLESLCNKLHLPKYSKIPMRYICLTNGNVKVATLPASRIAKEALIEMVNFWNDNHKYKWNIEEQVKYHINRKVVAKHLQQLFGVRKVEVNLEGRRTSSKITYLRIMFTDEIAMAQTRIQQILATLKLAGIEGKTSGFCTMVCYKV